MAELSAYRDQHFKGSRGELENKLETSATLYVGNLSFYTTEEQIHELFSRAGDLKRIVMGLDKIKRTPCGFCFIDDVSQSEAEPQLQDSYDLDWKSMRWKQIVSNVSSIERKWKPADFPSDYLASVTSPYYAREDAQDAVWYVNGTRLDDRIIRTDWDAGFIEGRQYGRGKSGGQVRDEYRSDFDPGRGGFGKKSQQQSPGVITSPPVAYSKR